MVARTLEWNFRHNEAPQRIGKQLAGRIKNGRMVQACRAGSGRRPAAALPGIEAEVMMIPARRDERGAWAAGRQSKTQHATVKIEGPLQVGDLKMDMADPHPRVDGGELQSLFIKAFWLNHGSILALWAFAPHMYDMRMVG